MAAIREQRRVNLKAFGLTFAIVIAPFLGLLYSLDLALAILALALAFTTWLTWHGASVVGAVHATQLRVAAGLNAVLMLATLALLALRLTS